MNEQEFIARWTAEAPLYAAWGEHVTATIMNELGQKIAPASPSYFVKIPPSPRVKEERSLIDKAFYRPKNYTDPYNQITDKVGVRFVVLQTRDIETIASIVDSVSSWEKSRDRDYEKEMFDAPDVFGYQSVHYVVRAGNDVPVDGVVVPKGTPCEIQIRTLLQHAHSELTHDTIYKPKTTASSRAKRYCARSMALIEATDDFFLKVVDEIELAGRPMEVAMNTLTTLYRISVGKAPEPATVSTIVLDEFSEALNETLEDRLKEFLSANPYVPGCIARRAEYQLLFRQPVILLLYYLAEKSPREMRSRWPLTPNELRPIYDDLGQTLD